MAKQVKLSATRRTGTGRSAVRKIKAQGAVPAIIYGGKNKPEALQVSKRDISLMLSHASGENILVELEIDGRKGRPARARAGSAACTARRRYFACRFPRRLDGRNDRGRRAARANRHGRRGEDFWRSARTRFALARDRMSAEGSCRMSSPWMSRISISGTRFTCGKSRCRKASRHAVPADLTAFSVLAPTVEEEPVAAEVAAGPGSDHGQEGRGRSDGSDRGRLAREREGSEEVISGLRAGADVNEAAAPIRLIAGLGNPGREYQRTRHNIGFMVLDRLAADAQLPWDYSEKWSAGWAKSDVIMVKPATFMNRSGEAVAAIANFYKIAAAEILVVLDDLALPLGRLRLRAQGCSGGHNGLESVFEHFGTEAVPRLRVGIGAAPSRRCGRLCARSLF